MSQADGLAAWAAAMEEGARAISELGGAKPGDRTMIDALEPFVSTLKNSAGKNVNEALRTAVENAQRGADATAQMQPGLGRSSYLQERVLGHADPGAVAVVIWLRAVVGAVTGG